MSKRSYSLVLIVPTLLLTILIVYKRTHTVAVSNSSFDSDVIRFWQSLPFQTIEPTVVFQKQIQTMSLISHCSISERQRTLLHDAIYHTFIGLSDGSYDSYRKFRTPTPAKLNPGIFNEKNREMLVNGAKELLAPGERAPDDFEEYVKVMSTRMNGGHGLTNYWLGACLTDGSVTVDESTNLPPDLLGIAGMKERVGLFRPPHFFVLEHDEKNILSEDGRIIFATLSIVTKHNPPDPPFRIYIRYFWDEKYACWSPAEYVSAFSAKRNRDLIF